MQLQRTKRTPHIVAGEGRSANRTKWSVDTAPIPPAVMQPASTRTTSESSAADLVSPSEAALICPRIVDG